MLRTFLLLFILGFSASGEEWIRGIIRVNTDVSSGEESLDTVCKKAKEAGLQYIIVTDQLISEARYGLPPFRHVLRYRKSKKSIMTFGVEKYLSLIEEEQKKYPELILVPGADIAPAYFVSGNPIAGNMVIDQWSEQLTVFGNDSPEFFYNLPALHKEQIGFGGIYKFLLLILIIPGILLLRGATIRYDDVQGNTYKIRNKPRLIFAWCLILIGVLGTLNLRPFHKTMPYSQYERPDSSVYQYFLDYTAENGAVAFWSAPEANMDVDIDGVKIKTQGYLKDILSTYKHNGMAGIYGDKFTAHEAGNAWDQLLKEYLDGVRKNAPVITGEADYHGKKRKIDAIMTVARVKEKSVKAVTAAVKDGHSYALRTTPEGLVMKKFELKTSKTGSCGDHIPFAEIADLKIEFLAEDTFNGKLIIVLSGKLYNEIELNGQGYTLSEKLQLTGKKGYLRLYVKDKGGQVVLLTNPVFYGKGE